MNKEILLIVDSISNEKNMEKEIIFRAVETALEVITAKRYEEEVQIRVAINRKTGDYDTFRRWVVVEDNSSLAENVNKYIELEKAKKIDADLEVNDIIEEPVESIKFEFGRIEAQQARQIIMREIRLAEKNDVIKKYQEKLNTLMTGVVQKVNRENVFLNMGDGFEGVISREQLIPREIVHVGDRVRAILREIKNEKRGLVLHLSRTCNEMITELFKLEVPEINEDSIQVKAVSRDPGFRAKMAVKTNDGRIDPIGACVGIRGSRVVAVTNELGGEKIDIVLWDADPAQFVVNAMAPAEIVSIVVDEPNKSMDLVVKEEQLAQAIGKSGQNVKLASDLTSWKLNVLTAEQEDKKAKAENAVNIEFFVKSLDVDEEIAEILVQEGFQKLEDIAYSPLEELSSISDFDEDIAEALRDRARDVLLEQALVSSNSLTANNVVDPAKDLLEMEGMTRPLAYVLASNGIITREDLAEQSVDELIEISDLGKDKAAELIMTARKPWFE